MSNPSDPKACSERADNLGVSDPLAVTESLVADAVLSDSVVPDPLVSDQGADEARRPPRRKERARVKGSKRQRDAAATTSEPAAIEGARVKLAANCTIRDCSTLKSDLGAVLAAPASVGIDVSSLERIDTAAIQLLCAFVRDRKARQLGVTWDGESAALTEAARLLGVVTALGLGDTPMGSGAVSKS